MVPVARALAGAPGPVLFGIGRPGDASRLRQAGITQTLVMLGPFLRSEVASLVKYGVTPTVNDWDGALALDRAAEAGGRTIGVHLKVDTGMGRVGVWHEEAFDFADNFRKLCPHLERRR